MDGLVTKVMDRLSRLIDDKKQAKKDYEEERNRLEKEFTKVGVWLVGWLVGWCPIGWLVGWLVSDWLFGWLVGVRLVGWLVYLVIYLFFYFLFDWLIND